MPSESFDELYRASFEYLDGVEGRSGVVSVDPNLNRSQGHDVDRLTVDGHLLPADTDLKLGSVVDAGTIDGWKRNDFAAALRGAKKQIGGFEGMPLSQKVAGISFVYQNGEFFSTKHPRTANLMRQGRLYEAGEEFHRAGDGRSLAKWTGQIQAPRMANDIFALTGFKLN